MKSGLRQSMAALHTWSGLMVCWVMLLVMSCGTASYYKDAMTVWMTPELRVAAAHQVAPAQAAAVALRALAERASGAPSWTVTLPTGRMPATTIAWTVPGRTGPGGWPAVASLLLDPASGAALAPLRQTRGGEFFYRLHFDLHYMPALWGRWIVGAGALGMLVAIVSGIITHKRLLQDIFTFRPGRGQRSWLDGHNLLAVLPLPYHLVVAYTGLVTLMFMYLPAAVRVVYHGDQVTYAAEMLPSAGQARPRSGRPAALIPIGPVLAAAASQWQGQPAAAFTVDRPGDAAATLLLTRSNGAMLSYRQPTMRFDGIDGRLLASAGDTLPAGLRAQGVLYGLHMAHYAGPWLRALYFLCGLAGCGMLASGALLWAVKARQRQCASGTASAALRLVDGLNIGVIAGLPLAYATYFWANCLLPAGLEQRPQVEIACFFWAWGAVAALGLLAPARATWRRLLAVAGALFVALPVLAAATDGNGPWSACFGAFDLVLSLLGLGLGLAAYCLRGSGGRA